MNGQMKLHHNHSHLPPHLPPHHFFFFFSEQPLKAFFYNLLPANNTTMSFVVNPIEPITNSNGCKYPPSQLFLEPENYVSVRKPNLTTHHLISQRSAFSMLHNALTSVFQQ